MASGSAPERESLESYRARVRGCLLGGAIGDALGGPVEFWNLQRIEGECGTGGVRDYLPEDIEGDPTARTPADNQTVRNVFVIGPDKKIKLILVSPMTRR